MVRYLPFILVTLMIVACKDDTPSVELLDIDLSQPVTTIVDPDHDALRGGVDSSGWIYETYIFTRKNSRYSLAGVPIENASNEEAFMQDIEFKMFSPLARDYAIADWERQFEWSNDTQAWSARQPQIEASQEELLAMSGFFSIRDLHSDDDVSDLLETTQVTDGISGFSVSFSLQDGAENFDRVVEALKARLGPSPSTDIESYGDAFYWVTEDRVVFVMDHIKTIEVRSFRQVREGCMVWQQQIVDVENCDEAALIASQRYIVLPFPPE